MKTTTTPQTPSAQPCAPALASKLAEFLAAMESLSPTERRMFEITQSLMDALEEAAGHLWDAGRNSCARNAEKTLDDACKAFDEISKQPLAPTAQ